MAHHYSPFQVSEVKRNPVSLRNRVSGVYFMQRKPAVTKNFKSSPLSEIISKFYFPNPLTSFFCALGLDLDLLTSATAS